MAHYALLSSKNKVIRVITGRDEDDIEKLPSQFDDWEEYYESLLGFVCKRTSYNTQNNQHSLGGTPFRGNYAGIGFIYDEAQDLFYPQQPFPSWTFDSSIANWQPPVPMPTDDKPYLWNEEDQIWEEVVYTEAPESQPEE